MFQERVQKKRDHVMSPYLHPSVVNQFEMFLARPLDFFLVLFLLTGKVLDLFPLGLPQLLILLDPVHPHTKGAKDPDMIQEGFRNKKSPLLSLVSHGFQLEIPFAFPRLEILLNAQLSLDQ